LKDPWMSVCCSKDNPSSYCKPNKKNICSNSLKKDGALFYSYCQNSNQTMCGTKTKDMSFEVGTKVNTFKIIKLRRFEQFQKLPDSNCGIPPCYSPVRYDACSYTLQKTPLGLYSKGQIKVQFPKLTNVEVYLNGGFSK